MRGVGCRILFHFAASRVPFKVTVLTCLDRVAKSLGLATVTLRKFLLETSSRKGKGKLPHKPTPLPQRDRLCYVYPKTQQISNFITKYSNSLDSGTVGAKSHIGKGVWGFSRAFSPGYD